MKISKTILVSGCLAGLTLSGWSQDASTSDESVSLSDAQATVTPTFTVLYNFGTKAGDAAGPNSLAQGRDGNMYGTSSNGGGRDDEGIVFKITPIGAETILHSFNGVEGSSTKSDLTLGADGNFYGTTYFGGTVGEGNLFKITPSGTFTVLLNFTGSNNGSNPDAEPIQAGDGNFYGTTAAGGSSGNGTVYRLSSAGELTTIYTFGANGFNPVKALVQGTDGYYLYGITYQGGSNGDGVVYRISPFGTYNVLYNFDGTHGQFPDAALIQASDGNFYGVTQQGGTNGQGVIFQITPSGVLTALHNFGAEANDGGTPLHGLVQATDGNLYGTSSQGGTNGLGTIYELTLKGAYSIVHNFDSTGGAVGTRLLQHTNGKLYGTGAGGTSNAGTFYSLDVGAPAFVRLVSAFGAVGDTVEILGQGFTKATTVTFGDVAGTVNVQSSTYLTATVPSGALFGAVTVTTSGGTLSSNQKFRIIPVITSFEPTSGPPGTEVTIQGSGFTQTTNVTFNAIEAASFTVNSDSQITARVSSAATAGPIAITRKGPITGRSSGVFTVTK